MNSKDIQRYFEQRPKAEKLYSIGSIVFINPDDASQYANETGSVVETHLRNDQEAPKVEEQSPNIDTIQLAKNRSTRKKVKK